LRVETAVAKGTPPPRLWFDANGRCGIASVLRAIGGWELCGGRKGAVARTGRPTVRERPLLRSATGVWWQRLVGPLPEQGDLRFANGPCCPRRRAMVGRRPQSYRAGRDRPLPGLGRSARRSWIRRNSEYFRRISGLRAHWPA